MLLIGYHFSRTFYRKSNRKQKVFEWTEDPNTGITILTKIRWIYIEPASSYSVLIRAYLFPTLVTISVWND